MVSLCDRMVYALIDPGATRSFIAHQLANSLELPYEDMDIMLSGRASLGENVIVKRECKDCVFKIGETQLRVDLVVMQSQDFELILGMDWLVEHRVTMNGSTRERIIDHPRGNLV